MHNIAEEQVFLVTPSIFKTIVLVRLEVAVKLTFFPETIVPGGLVIVTMGIGGEAFATVTVTTEEVVVFMAAS